MKKIMTGIVLSSIAFFSSAEITFKSEILIGQTSNKVYSLQQKPSILNESSSSPSLNSDSVGFRLGFKFTENFSLELSKQDHGEVVHQFTTTIPSTPSLVCCLSSNTDTIYEAEIPINTGSIRFGVKGELPLLENFSINARLGVAHWEYDNFTPQRVASGVDSGTAKSGNDIYYSLGAEYKWTKNLYIGIEYSFLTISESYDSQFDASGSYKYDLNDLSLIAGWVF